MKKEFKKWVALLCVAVCLAVSVPAVPVQASTVGSLEKTLDLVLVKLGVVCNENGLNSVANKLYDTAVGNVQEFDEYCSTNSLDPKDSSSYDSWCETREYQDRLLDMVMENKYRIAAEEGSDVTLDFTKDDMNDAIHGGGGIRRGEQYTIDEDTVGQIHNAFQTWFSANSDFFIVQTHSISEYKNSAYFNSNDDYQEFCTFAENFPSSGVYMFQFPEARTYFTNAMKFWHWDDISLIGYNWYYTSRTQLACDTLSGMNDNWESVRPLEKWLYFSSDSSCTDSNCIGTFDNWLLDGCSRSSPSYVTLVTPTFSLSDTQLVTKYRSTVKVWRSADAFKGYSVGQQSIYFTTTYDYSITNTVTYTGDYYCDTSSSYTYTTVQENIDNSTDISESIVNSIVDDSTTTIINNYYYTSSSDDGSGDGSDDGSDDSSDSDSGGNIFERVLDALGGLVGDLLGLLEELVDLFLSGIVSAIGIVVQGLTTAVSKLKELSLQVEGITGFLTSFFGFVPVDYWDIITSLMMISFVVIVIKLFRGK